MKIVAGLFLIITAIVITILTAFIFFKGYNEIGEEK